MFSSRLPPSLAANRLTHAVERARASGRPLVDLTLSNPTLADLEYPAGLLGPLGRPEGLRYTPEPFGLSAAREAVASEYTRLGGNVPAANVVLTASTSEAYAWIFKLLCDAGDEVLVPQPSYPLFDHLGRLEQTRMVGYALDPHTDWSLDRRSLVEAATSRTRAVLVVAPNNPTGSRLASDDWQWLDAWCAGHNLAIVVDEVFADYVICPRPGRVTTVTSAPGGWAPQALTLALGGLSKSCGLPQVKVGWMALAGEPRLVSSALARLELIADTYLSVSTPAQRALPALIAAGAAVRDQIAARVTANAAALEAVLGEMPSCSVLVPEAGWSAVIRVPAIEPEEELVVALVDEASVLVHPGFFFDFPYEAFLVTSLLTPTPVLVEGLRRVTGFFAARLAGDGAPAVAPVDAIPRP